MSGQDTFLTCRAELYAARQSRQIERMDEAIANARQYLAGRVFIGEDADRISKQIRSVESAKEKLSRSMAIS